MRGSLSLQTEDAAKRIVRRVSKTVFEKRLSRALVRLDLPVADVDDAVGARGDVLLVRDEDDGVSGLVQPLEEAHDLVRSVRVERARRLVGQKNGRVVDDRARDCDTVALAARETVGAVER